SEKKNNGILTDSQKLFISLFFYFSFYRLLISTLFLFFNMVKSEIQNFRLR
ncbi:hypothetical protein Mgra_00003279, partial [Meloidogyne graminicola]